MSAAKIVRYLSREIGGRKAAMFAQSAALGAAPEMARHYVAAARVLWRVVRKQGKAVSV